MSHESLTDSVSRKLADKEDLTEEEQSILREELKLAKTKILISKISVVFIIFLQFIFFVYIAYRITIGLSFLAVDQKPKSDHVAILNIDTGLKSE